MTPTSDGSEKERTLFRGKYFDRGKTVEFDEPGFEHKKIDLDADLVKGLADSFASDQSTRDGIEHDLFPLNSKEQRKYNFKLEGADEYRGMPVYRITFDPKKKAGLPGCRRSGRRRRACGPARFWSIATNSSRCSSQPRWRPEVPLWVKAMFGTDIQQLGFKVTYQKFDEGLWFPVTYGGEFKVKALFLYSRRIAISMKNSGFERAVVDSKVRYADIH